MRTVAPKCKVTFIWPELLVCGEFLLVSSLFAVLSEQKRWKGSDSTRSRWQFLPRVVYGELLEMDEQEEPAWHYNYGTAICSLALSVSFAPVRPRKSKEATL